MVRFERLAPPLRHDLAEARARAQRHRQRIVAEMRFLIEQDVALAHLDERIALLRQRQADIGLGKRLLQTAGLNLHIAGDNFGQGSHQVVGSQFV